MVINKWEFNNRHSSRWLFLFTVSLSNWNFECWFFWKEENPRACRKTLGVRFFAFSQLQVYMRYKLRHEDHILLLPIEI